MRCHNAHGSGPLPTTIRSASARDAPASRLGMGRVMLMVNTKQDEVRCKLCQSRYRVEDFKPSLPVGRDIRVHYDGAQKRRNSRRGYQVLDRRKAQPCNANSLQRRQQTSHPTLPASCEAGDRANHFAPSPTRESRQRDDLAQSIEPLNGISDNSEALLRRREGANKASTREDMGMAPCRGLGRLLNCATGRYYPS